MVPLTPAEIDRFISGLKVRYPSPSSAARTAATSTSSAATTAAAHAKHRRAAAGTIRA
ncbi:MAG: hypothetical protein AB1753_09950 [Thermoproteota archaeon]